MFLRRCDNYPTIPSDLEFAFERAPRNLVEAKKDTGSEAVTDDGRSHLGGNHSGYAQGWLRASDYDEGG